jgi:phthalate 4,5-dioxygenase oxygenase subunit
MQDRAKMTDNFTGMGTNFNTHDAFATETPGRIQNRTKEHLATSDIAIAAARRLMLKAIDDVKAGRDPIGLIRGAAQNRFDELLSFDVVAPEAIPNDEIVRQVLERQTAMV